MALTTLDPKPALVVIDLQKGLIAVPTVGAEIHLGVEPDHDRRGYATGHPSREPASWQKTWGSQTNSDRIGALICQLGGR